MIFCLYIYFSIYHAFSAPERDEMQGAEKELNFFSNDPLSRVVGWQSRDLFSTILVPSWLCEPRRVIKPFSTPVTLCVKGEAGFNCVIIFVCVCVFYFFIYFFVCDYLYDDTSQIISNIPTIKVSYKS